MAKQTTNRAEVKVTMSIRPGVPSPAEETAWRKFWRKFIADVSANDFLQPQDNPREVQEK